MVADLRPLVHGSLNRLTAHLAETITPSPKIAWSAGLWRRLDEGAPLEESDARNLAEVFLGDASDFVRRPPTERSGLAILLAAFVRAASHPWSDALAAALSPADARNPTLTPDGAKRLVEMGVLDAPALSRCGATGCDRLGVLLCGSCGAARCAREDHGVETFQRVFRDEGGPQEIRVFTRCSADFTCSACARTSGKCAHCGVRFQVVAAESSGWALRTTSALLWQRCASFFDAWPDARSRLVLVDLRYHRRYVIEPPRQVLGRQGDVAVMEPTVARRHAEVALDGGQWMIEDLRSPGGTFVNGLSVKGRAVLRPADRVRIGRLDLLVR